MRTGENICNPNCVPYLTGNYYGDDTTLTCLLCSVKCTRCFGPTSTDCTVCASGYFYYQPNNECLTDCPNQFFEDNTITATPICSPCISPCLTCNVDGNDCVTCVAGTYLETNRCRTQCVALNLYENVATNVCSPCSSTCTACETTPANC